MRSLEFTFRCQECGTLVTTEQLLEAADNDEDEACPSCGSTDLDIAP